MYCFVHTWSSLVSTHDFRHQNCWLDGSPKDHWNQKISSLPLRSHYLSPKLVEVLKQSANKLVVNPQCLQLCVTMGPAVELLKNEPFRVSLALSMPAERVPDSWARKYHHDYAGCPARPARPGSATSVLRFGGQGPSPWELCFFHEDMVLRTNHGEF